MGLVDVALILFFPLLLGVSAFVGIRKWRASVALTQDQKKQLRDVVRSLFADPLAEQIEWTPLKIGGSFFRSYRLTRPGAERIGFRLARTSEKPPAAKEARAVLLVTLAAPYIAAAFIALFGEPWAAKIMVVAISVCWGTGGVLVAFVYWKNRPHFLDNRLGLYSVGIRKGRLKDIHALQIVAEKVETRRPPKGMFKRHDHTPWWSYELNLVLEDRGRINLLDHGDLDSLRSDAGLISRFLGVPIWDSTTAPFGSPEVIPTLHQTHPTSSYHTRLFFLLGQSLKAANQAARSGSNPDDDCQNALRWLRELLLSQSTTEKDSITPTVMAQIEEAIQYLHRGLPEEAEEVLRKAWTELKKSLE